MTLLSDFPDEQRELIVALPYVVGLNLSYADDADGEVDDEREMKALENCIKAIAKMHEKQPFVSAVMAETLARKSDWAKWEGHVFQAPKMARQAMQAVLQIGSEAEAKNYRAALMEIASTVAKAFGEFGEFEDEPEPGFFGGLVSKLVGGLSAISEDDANHPMNVSAAEDSAIEALRQALKF